MPTEQLSRITVTIQQPLLSSVDSLVKSGQAKNRSHSISILLRKALANQMLKKSLILAGGKKSNLQFQNTIKPLVDVDGVSVLRRTLLHLKKFNITEDSLCIGYGGDKIVSEFENGNSLGLKINYNWEDSTNPLGSATCIKEASGFLNEPFVFSYSDVLYDELDFLDFYQFHQSNNSICTLALANSFDPLSFGVAKLSGSKIVEFEEKPADSKSALINAGVAICDPSMLSFIPSGTKYSFEKDLLPKLAKLGKLHGYIYSGAWFDVGTPKGLTNAVKHYSIKKN